MQIRQALRSDLPALVQLLASDVLGKSREAFHEPLPEAYVRAFEQISRDPAHRLLVLEEEDQGIVATLQLSFIPYLSYQGGLRAQLESVHVRHDQQGKGYGRQLIAWAIQEASARGARLVQLTSDKQRPRAIAFYEKLGFRPSHVGMKLYLATQV